MTYVEKLARLVYYVLIVLIVGAGFYFLLPIGAGVVAILKDSGAWEYILGFGGALALFGLACVVTWVFFDVHAAPRTAVRRHRGRVWVAASLVPILFTIAGYIDSAWSGVRELWSLAAMVLLFWAVLGGGIALLAVAIRTGERIISRGQRNPPPP